MRLNLGSHLTFTPVTVTWLVPYIHETAHTTDLVEMPLCQPPSVSQAATSGSVERGVGTTQCTRVFNSGSPVPMRRLISCAVLIRLTSIALRCRSCTRGGVRTGLDACVLRYWSIQGSTIGGGSMRLVGLFVCRSAHRHSVPNLPAAVELPRVQQGASPAPTLVLNLDCPLGSAQ